MNAEAVSSAALCQLHIHSPGTARTNLVMAYHASVTILSVIEALAARKLVQYSPTFMYGTSAS
jgi:hypothetical protein